MAEERRIYGVLEGTSYRDVEKTHYLEIDFQLPLNAQVLLIGKTRMDLYGRLKDDFKFNYNTLCVSHLQRRFEHKKLFAVEGVQLTDPNRKDPNWLAESSLSFEFPRSIVTREGAIYLNEVFFKNRIHEYLEELPAVVLDACSLIQRRIRHHAIKDLQRVIY